MIGKYTLLKEIGRGLNGTVFLAQDKNSNTQVAIKFSFAKNVHGLKAEFDLMKKAECEHIVSGIEYNLHDGQDYMVMSLEGDSLEKLNERNRFDEKTIAYFLYHTLVALQSIHGKSVVHMDIKAPNVAVGVSHKKALLVLLDFGSAKKADFNSMIHDVENTFSMCEVLSNGEFEIAYLTECRQKLASFKGIINYELLLEIVKQSVEHFDPEEKFQFN